MPTPAVQLVERGLFSQPQRAGQAQRTEKPKPRFEPGRLPHSKRVRGRLTQTAGGFAANAGVPATGVRRGWTRKIQRPTAVCGLLGDRLDGSGTAGRRPLRAEERGSETNEKAPTDSSSATTLVRLLDYEKAQSDRNF